MKIFFVVIVGFAATTLLVMIFARNGSDIRQKNDDLPSPNAPFQNDTVRVTAPLPVSVVTSPLMVTGEARGTWYFEASFPVTVRDANDQVLGTGVAQAQGEWMTIEFVPFQVTVSFNTSSTSNGFLVLHKDNPSGLPENDAEVRIPIRF